MSSSYLENQFQSLWSYYHSDIQLQREYQFAKPRKFRADFAHVEARVLIDIQGGTWSRNRKGHNRGSKIENDCIKLGIASSQGWTTFLLTGQMINYEWLEVIAETIKSKSH